MGPHLADTYSWLDEMLSWLGCLVLRYGRYLGERDAVLAD